jgi:hypothetical protein
MHSPKQFFESPTTRYLFLQAQQPAQRPDALARGLRTQAA